MIRTEYLGTWHYFMTQTSCTYTRITGVRTASVQQQYDEEQKMCLNKSCLILRVQPCLPQPKRVCEHSHSSKIPTRQKGQGKPGRRVPNAQQQALCNSMPDASPEVIRIYEVLGRTRHECTRVRCLCLLVLVLELMAKVNRNSDSSNSNSEQ